MSGGELREPCSLRLRTELVPSLRAVSPGDIFCLRAIPGAVCGRSPPGGVAGAGRALRRAAARRGEPSAELTSRCLRLLPLSSSSSFLLLPRPACSRELSIMASRRMETKPVITCLKTLLIIYSFVFWVSAARPRCRRPPLPHPLPLLPSLPIPGSPHLPPGRVAPLLAARGKPPAPSPSPSPPVGACCTPFPAFHNPRSPPR